MASMFTTHTSVRHTIRSIPTIELIAAINSPHCFLHVEHESGEPPFVAKTFFLERFH